MCRASRSADANSPEGPTMFNVSQTFSGFSSNDLPAAKSFYTEKLGLQVSEQNGMLSLDLEGRHHLIYPKPDHEPATYTVLNFPTPDIEATIDELRAQAWNSRSTRAWTNAASTGTADR
jgi:extradiol dioxygenase family protein